MAPTAYWRQHLAARISFHGVANIIEASGTYTKLFWATLLFLSFGGLLRGVIKNTLSFINSDILTTYSLQITQFKRMDFPSVYICPMSPLSSSKSKDHFPSATTQAHEYLNSANEGSLLSAKSKLWDITEQFNQIHFNVLHAVQPPTLENLFLTLGFEVDDFFKECRFQDAEINCSKIVTRKFDKDYGLCFLVDGRHRQNRENLGLQLLIDLNTDSATFVPLLNGLALNIQRSFDPTLTSGQFFYAGAGMNTKIQLHAIEQNLINFTNPKGTVKQKCHQEGYEPQFKILQNIEYSMSACRMDCVQQTVNARCGCVMPLEDEYLNPQFNKNCDNDSIKSCFFKTVMLIYANETELCMEKCWPPCKSWTYEMTTSFGLLANENLTSDFVLLDIAFDALHYTELNQSAAMSETTFISHIGGQLNLWHGASLLSVVQILGIFSRFCFTKIKTRMSASSSFVEENELKTNEL